MNEESIPLNALPPLALEHFMSQIGWSPSTCWRARKRGVLKTIVIAGRHYVTREAIAEFNARAELGEFKGTAPTPAGTGKKGGAGK